MGSCVSQAVLSLLLEDDRVGMHLRNLEDTVREELHWVLGLPEFCWQELACVVGDVPPSSIRDCVARCAVASAGYLHYKIFLPANDYPWCLVTHASTQSQLDLLAGQHSPPEDETTAKIHSLITLGYNREAILQGLELLKHARWSTTTLEQGHASASVIHKGHKQLGKDVLAQRAFLHMMRTMLSSSTPSRAEAALLQKIQEISKKIRPRSEAVNNSCLSSC